MKLLRKTLMGLALLVAAGAALAADNDPPVAPEPIPQDDVAPGGDTARPDWANPDAEEPVGGVDDDPTPFDLGTNPPDPD
jgi:hypothetical protein